MKIVRVYKFVAKYPMTPLFIALWTAIVAIVGSADATKVAFATNEFSAYAYWVVTAAVVTILFAHMTAYRAKAKADKAPAFWPRMQAMIRR